MQNPTSSARNLGRIASGGMMGPDPYFDEKLKEGLSEIRNSINRQFSGIGLYGSSAHKNELNNGLGDALARIKYDRRDRDLQHMMQANAMIDQYNQNQAGVANNYFQGYNNAVFEKALREELDEVENRINRYFSAIGRYGTPDHRDALRKASSSIYARAIANQYDANFEKVLEKSMDSVRNTIKGSFSENGRYGSGAHRETLERELEDLAANHRLNHYYRNRHNMLQANAAYTNSLQKAMNRVRDEVNSVYYAAGRGGSGAHADAMENGLTNAMVNHYNQYVQDILQANALLGELNKYQLATENNLLQQQSNAYANVLQNAVNLETDNQRRVDTQRAQWVKEDNRAWKELQDKADMLHKAAAVDNALQGQNKALANTIRKEIQKVWDTETATNIEKKAKASVSPLPLIENNLPLNSSQTEGEHSGNEFLPAHTIPQQKEKENTTSSTPKTTPNTSSEAQVNFPSKIETTSKTAGDAEKPSKLADNNKTVALSHTPLNSEEKTKTLTPQMANTLVMPNALFAVGFSDINNHNILLDNMRITMFEPKENEKNGLFFSTYGNILTFSRSVNSPQENVRTNIHYAALQVGFKLITLEDQNTITDFGFLGSYGKLAFIPKDIEGSQKSTFDKWSLTAYGNLQHDSGIYANAFLSYGIFKENISTTLVRNTKNNTKTVNASATVGQKLPLNIEGFILEPQAQLSYQYLMLGILPDTDNFKTNMRNLHQGMLRIGGRLTQNKGHAVSFYSKLYITETFGHKSAIEMGKSFQLLSMGTAVEGGFGAHAHLSHNIALHGDVSYQHKLRKAGLSGMNVSAGMRYCF
ncbi:autotransporter outer membrane beta-barrel domain-containing protein [Bartonella vinsonii]|uniref:Type V secretory pathway, adhesin AidA n=1 Tax=Bartonella vinsonii TaxID=33047 RepID=A0A3S5C6U9_BARVI|nr:autotransporter outer membrane beta-barrel domain-containing protein [Bartonella vinsonii]VEJ45872.1 Type V secretory pathway, adhesin AidA [Bartonella vinsonii]